MCVTKGKHLRLNILILFFFQLTNVSYLLFKEKTQLSSMVINHTQINNQGNTITYFHIKVYSTVL